MSRQTPRPEGPSSAIHYSSSSSRSASPSPPSSPPLSPLQDPTQDKPPPPPPLPSSRTDNDSKPADRESPHEATARRLPTRAWNEKDEAHRLSLHHLTYSDTRFNPPPPSLWKRLALIGLCVVLVWAAFSARLGVWKGKKALGKRVWAEKAAALRLAKENAVPIAQTTLGGQKTRPTTVPTFVQAAVPVRDEI